MNSDVGVGGGYDRGYAACPMFWPDRPGSLLADLELRGQLSGGTALDAGCGEGTNAAWLADQGYEVQAVELSSLALEHARIRNDRAGITWTQADVEHLSSDRLEHDLVVAYGLLHCVPAGSIDRVIRRLCDWTKSRGLLVIVAFNDRSQDLERAHAGFNPTLLSHDAYLAHLDSWKVLTATDMDLYESHPDTNIPHHHSMTRIVARCP